MSVVISDCVGCANLKSIKTDRVNGGTEMFCLAFPDGIPQEVLVTDKREGGICAGDIGFKLRNEKKFKSATA